MSKPLPDRPRGVRRHWKREFSYEADLSTLNELLGSVTAEFDFGEEILEARVFSYRRITRKVVARFDSGWVVSRSWNKFGGNSSWSARKSGA